MFPVSALDNVRVTEELALEERFYALQVKQKEKPAAPARPSTNRP